MKSSASIFGMQIVLASGSPRRKQILENLGFNFIIKQSDEPEPEAKSTNEIDKIAEFKAKSVAKEITKLFINKNLNTDKPDCNESRDSNISDSIFKAFSSRADLLVIGSDTAVCHEDKVLGKPKNKGEAQTMLKSLSGSTHNVVSGISMILIENDLLQDELKNSNDLDIEKFINDCPKFQNSETTEVTFRKLSDQEISNYIGTHEPMDKAGAYGIQGIGGMLVEHVNGCYNNVVGLPVTQLLAGMRQLGCTV